MKYNHSLAATTVVCTSHVERAPLHLHTVCIPDSNENKNVHQIADGGPSCAAVLCLDLGTTTGWAVHSRQGIITSGTVNFKNDRWQGGGTRFLKFIRFLQEINGNTGYLDMVFFEEVRRHAGVDAAHAYGGFMAHLTAWCEQCAIAYEGVPVGTIKRHATGKGNANKPLMMEAARRRGHVPADDNEADALALVYWALENRLGVKL